MSEEINKNINKLGYKPDIKYESNYYSDKDLSESISYTYEEKAHNPIKDVIDKIDNLDTLVNGLPESIKDLINNVYEPIKDILDEELSDKEYGEIPDYGPNFVPSNNNNESEPGNNEEDYDNIDDDDDTPEEDSDVFTPKVNIIVDTPISNKHRIEKEYIKHLTDLIAYYVNKLDDAVNNYWMHLIPILNNVSTENKIFILSDITDMNSNTISADKKHLFDFAIRNQIHRQTKTSLASKVFSLEETLTNFRNFKLSYELRIRHSVINKIDEDYSRSADDKNRILDACNLIYETKYDNSYGNLIKYVNSATEMVDQMLSLSVHESTSKQYLI